MGNILQPEGQEPALLATPKLSSRSNPHRYLGRVVYVYAFDLAYEMTRQQIPTCLGQPVAQFSVDSSKRSPRQLFFHRPQMVRLPPLERFCPFGPIRLERTIKILPVGAISITASVPFAVDAVSDLVAFHDLEFNNGSLSQEIRELAEEVRRELSPYCIRPQAQLMEEEAYTIFCLDAPLLSESGERISAEKWFHEHRIEVAAVLTQESDAKGLSQQEAEESTARYFSYYYDDLAVIDWDAALIVDRPNQFEETLYVLELANLQLAELEAYDRILDDALERSYRDLGPRLNRRRGNVLRELREISIDLARFSDELSNITKFFGDWHLARIYESISSRFHLTDWHRTIDEKLKTLDGLYQMLNDERTSRWMLFLELTIVLLFVVDLVMLFWKK